MRVLITGTQGQVGRALLSSVPAECQARGVSRAELDVTDAHAVNQYVSDYQPDVIINAAAYTAVDKAESEFELAELANAVAPRHLAVAAKHINARLIHISTDFVFDGRSSRPYAVNDPTAPLGVYGRTKLAGERAVQEVLGDRALTIRTAWVYDATGKNFLRTMLRLMHERCAVKVVADQIGTPTSSHSLADILWRCALQSQLSGVYHWTDAGVASWYDFAVAIAEEAVAVGLLKQLPVITPIATHEYPTPAHRPAFSVLDKSAIYAALNAVPVHWRVRLREVMARVEL